ncbi:NYN domain-containing protein [Daedaleopsis nitida]|nr:NYN domain-containing protein [Daedaleopsis nitida]
MSEPFNEHVAIFWDYENCAPPCSVPGYDVVNNIAKVSHEYGSVKLFKAYLELSEQSSSKSIGLRSELQSCGVSLTDCPHNGRKDVADKMMIVDMLTYAIDNPAPATIVLISGDRDFVYAVSVLRLRKYRVVLVAPNSAHASLKSQASVLLDWDTDIMRRTTVRPQTLEASHAALYDALLQRSPRRPTLSFGGPLPQPAPKHTRRPSFKVATPMTPVTPIIVGESAIIGVPAQGRHLRHPSIVTTDETLPPTLLYQASSGTEYSDHINSLRLQELRNDMDGSRCTPIPDILEIMRGSIEKRDQVSLTTLSGSSTDESSTDSQSPSATGLSVASVNNPAPISNTRIETLEPAASPQPNVTDEEPSRNIDNMTGSSQRNSRPVIAPEPVSFPRLDPESTVEPLSRVLNELVPLVPQLLSSASPEKGESHSPYRRAHLENDTQRQLSNAAKASPPISASCSDDASCIINPVTSSSPPVGSAVGQTPIFPPPPSAIAITDMPALAMTGADSTTPQAIIIQTPQAIRTPQAIQFSITVPTHFHHLMRVLEQSRLRGLEQPLRSWVGLQLPNGTYSQAKVTTFKAYAAAAEKAGLIVLGGAQAKAWVALSPDWHGKVPSLQGQSEA